MGNKSPRVPVTLKLTHLGRGARREREVCCKGEGRRSRKSAVSEEEGEASRKSKGRERLWGGLWLIERFPSIYKATGSIPSTAYINQKL